MVTHLTPASQQHSENSIGIVHASPGTARTAHCALPKVPSPYGNTQFVTPLAIQDPYPQPISMYEYVRVGAGPAGGPMLGQWGIIP